MKPILKRSREGVELIDMVENEQDALHFYNSLADEGEVYYTPTTLVSAMLIFGPGVLAAIVGLVWFAVNAGG